MVYIKCLNVKKSKMFFLIHSLNEVDSVKLFDKLHDSGVRMKAVKKEEIDDINPFLEEITDCFFIPKDGYNPAEVDIILNSKSYSGIKQIT